MEESMDIEEAEVPILYPTDQQSACDWNKKFEQGCLTMDDFKAYWRIWVPRVLSPQPNSNGLELDSRETQVKDLLLTPLEEFLCKERFCQLLTQLKKPPAVCGRVLKMGEPAYYCRECGLDPTCVLCVDCFKKSSHRNHKYRMGTSGGGGFCDCGDVEAWKKDPYCDQHLMGVNLKGEEENKLPEELIKRAEITFAAVLRYAYILLTLESTPFVPCDLKAPADGQGIFGDIGTTDSYCTVLYNDETHSFEQVISTLAKVLKCSQRDAIELVTNIDREGRAVVMCSIFQYCQDLKSEVERFTSRHGTIPLKVQVVHSHLVAHQVFALSLLSWLRDIMTLNEGFREIFSRVSLEVSSPQTSIIEGILLRDSTLWKSARIHWHRLFISAMFMEYENKKAFAKVFTKNYGTVMKDFIRDDHDHAFSISNLTVQVFTVPTLAHYLIAKGDVMMILLNTFLSECVRKLNQFNRLEFERNSPMPFKRAIYILHDLRYLLGSVPKEWTDDLRKGFLQGVHLILRLLSYMQGMDPVVRQVGQHMEYEPEWESAFNLLIRLAPVITMTIKWCASDKVVLVKAYRQTLKQLACDKLDMDKHCEVRELADHSASCIPYDVASQPVSIHLPLSRLLAGLHVHLKKYNLSFDSPELQTDAKLTPEEIIEPVLRTQVMVSQVHAGMWRRNGYSLANQIYFYHSAKCRSEMLDRDIVLLQMGASLIESNEFLIHVLNKYNLLNWASPQFETKTLKGAEEDGLRQIICLVEEFLTLIIHIFGERYHPGVGDVSHEECLKKEIIQQLCIKPLSHSDLNRTLPDDNNYETGMEEVIGDVAIFKKPVNSSSSGYYELKPELSDQYNVFFYHYTKEELSKSEEEQRKQRKANSGFECCPPPILPKLSDSFSMVANIIQCDVMLHVMRTVLERAINLRARSFSEAQVQKVLHLIGYALQEEEKKCYDFFKFTSVAEKWGIEQLLLELVGNARIEAHKDLLKWVIAKYKQVTTKQKSVSDVVPMEDESESDKEEKEVRSKLAAERRAKIMAQMAAMQRSFMKDNAQLFEEAVAADKREASTSIVEPEIETRVALGLKRTQVEVVVERKTCILCQEDSDLSHEGPPMVLAGFIQKSTVLARNRSDVNSVVEIVYPMFLSSNLGPSPHISSCGHVMHSSCWKKYFENVFAKENRRPYRPRQPGSFDVEKNEFLCPLCECLNNTVLPIIPPLASLPSKPKESLDQLSFDDWIGASLAAIDHKKKLDAARQSGQSCSKTGESASKRKKEQPKQEETPLPRGRGSGLQSYMGQTEGSEQVEIDSTVTAPSNDSDNETDEEETTTFLRRLVNVGNSSVMMELKLSSYRHWSDPDQSYHLNRLLSGGLFEMVMLFAQAVFSKGLDASPHEDDPGAALVTWKSCAYTIHSIEQLLRFGGKSLFGHMSSRLDICLQGLVRLSAVLGAVWKYNQVINRHGVRLLSLLVDNKSSDMSIMDWDCFGVLVPLTASLPNMFYSNHVSLPSGTVLELHTFSLMLYCQIAQVIINTDLSEFDCDEEGGVGSEETVCLFQLVKHLKKCSRLRTDDLWNRIKQEVRPFLRCCAIFYRYLTDIHPSKSFKEVGGDTFENLCFYLGVSSSCQSLLSPNSVELLFKLWGQHGKVVELRNKPGIYRSMLSINELVRLPEDYSELINTVSLFTCPNSDKEDSRSPTMCLVCGEMLCSQTYCCQTELNKIRVGACTSHAHTCGSGAGMFLRVRDCEILLLATPSRGCFKTPPYLDSYGETDQGLRRGNPLHLSKERYQKLQHIWLSHSIYEEIARAIESSHSLINTQWQHL